MGHKRTVSERGRSLYINLPTPIINDAGLKAGDVVDLRYIEGIGIVVSHPIMFSLSMSERTRGRAVHEGVKRGDRMFRSIDGEYLEVIPLHDGVLSKK